MNIFKKIFSNNLKEKQDIDNIKKPSFLRWLCSSKSIQSQNEIYQREKLDLAPLYTSINKPILSTGQLNDRKIMQVFSFRNNNPKQCIDKQVKSELLSIVVQVIDRIQDLLVKDGLYGMVNGEEPLSNKEGNDSIWLKIGKREQLNSLIHIKPYYFNNIFIFMDEFGFQFSIQQILLSRQNILLKVQQNSSIQDIIDSYQRKLIQYYGFKPLSECFSKLKLTLYEIKHHQTIWINFNESIPILTHIEDILAKFGFHLQNEQFLKLKEQIPKLITLQEYIEFIEHKNKLMNKYQSENVDQYIKNKFLQKINSKSHTPRNIDSPRTVQKSNSIQEGKSESSGYNDYILSMTVNTLPKQKMNEVVLSNIFATNIPEKNSYQQEIFQFNIYKEDKQQDAKRVAINKQRKKRSRSQDITVGDLHNCQDLEDENDYFDKRE